MDDIKYKKRSEQELRDILGEPDEKNGMIFVKCFEHKNEWYIEADTDGFTGGVMITELIDPIEKGFMLCHNRSYESSMSATINNIFYKWCVIKIDFNKILEYIENTNLYKCWNVSGGAQGAKLKKVYYDLFTDPTKHISAQFINESL